MEQPPSEWTWPVVFTVLISFLALVQPWVISAYKKLRRATVEAHRTGVIEIGYSNLGPVIGLIGTLEAIHQDLFIRSITLEVVRQADRAQHHFDWLAMRNPVVNLSRPQDTQIALASGFLLSTSRPQRYSILFSAPRLQEQISDILLRLQPAWSAAVQAATGAATQPLVDPQTAIAEFNAAARKAYPAFSQSAPHAQAFTEIDRLCYWTPGHYRLTMEVHSTRPTRSFSTVWDFELSQLHVDTVRRNTTRIVQSACGQFTGDYEIALVAYRPA